MRLSLPYLCLLGLACRQAPRSHPVTSHISVSRVVILAQDSTAPFPVEKSLEDFQAVALDPTSLAVLDYAQSRVVLLSTTGTVLRIVGRHGGGPGEFQNPRFLVHLASGFGVYDDAKLALVTFDRNGRAEAELGGSDLTGPLKGILTGLAQITDGWVYSVREPPPDGPREALYLRRHGVSQLLAATAVPPSRPLRMPCGIILSPQPPIFWPTLRWAATPSRIAYATTEQDRVMLLDAATGESTAILGDHRPQRATEEAAERLPLGLRVSTGRGGCTIQPREVIQQRGMAGVIPAITALALTPSGTLWIRLTGSRNGPAWRVHRSPTLTDTLSGDAFPSLFLSDTTALAEEGPTEQGAVLSLWAIHIRE